MGAPFKSGKGLGTLNALAPYVVYVVMPKGDPKCSLATASCPLYPQKQTRAVHQPMYALGQKRTCVQRRRYRPLLLLALG